jgi:GT2 family glycosyltransferase
MARGEHIVFLDNDTLVAQRDWLETLRDFLEADEQRAIVAPKMIFPWQPVSYRVLRLWRFLTWPYPVHRARRGT